MENQKNNKEQENLPACCQTNDKKDNKGLMQGLLYGTIPHIGCIAFIIGSILGVTILMQVFKPLLMNKFFFYYLILISLGFATLSSFLYLRKRNCCSKQGIKQNKNYLMIMYGTTIGINILFFFILFPYMANINNGVSAQEINNLSLSNLKIQVDIPCPGHAPLISNELKTINGVKGTEFSFPNNFLIYYDSKITNKDKILELEIFKEFKAKVLDENTNVNFIDNNPITDNNIQQPVKSTITNNVQEITMNIDSNGYSPSSFVTIKLN